jgi:hypothetical protein
MATKGLLGETGQAVVGAVALTAGMLVKFSTAGLLIACAGSDRPVGSVQDAYAAGATATYYKCRGNQHHLVAQSAIAAGDYVKTYAGGLVVTEASATVLTVNTIGQAIEASETDSGVDVVLY